MLSIDNNGDLTTDQPEGMVVAIIVTDEDWDYIEYGSVCDDTVNQAAADVICKDKGYVGAREFGCNRDYDDYIPE